MSEIVQQEFENLQVTAKKRFAVVVVATTVELQNLTQLNMTQNQHFHYLDFLDFLAYFAIIPLMRKSAVSFLSTAFGPGVEVGTLKDGAKSICEEV